jgi:Holliday junction resolvasome RuvABC endonuclease subunit
MGVGESSFVGMHIAAGVVWLAQATREDRAFINDPVDRLELESGDLSPGRALAELVESLESVLARLAPAGVALLSAGSGQNRPSTADLLRRGRIESAIMIAASHQSVPLVEVSHDAVKRAVGVSPAKKATLLSMLAERVPDPPKKWSERAPAYAAAIAAPALDRE